MRQFCGAQMLSSHFSFIYIHAIFHSIFFQCVKFPSLCSYQSFATFKMNKPTIFDYHGILKNMFEKNLGYEFPKFYRKEVKYLDESFQKLIKGFLWCTPFLQYALLYEYDLQYVQEIIAYSSIYTYTKKTCNCTKFNPLWEISRQ